MEFKCKFPRTQTLCKKLEGAYSFLLGSSLGSHDVLWECPITQVYSGFRLTRQVRKAGEYYREPYPLYLEILYPKQEFSPTMRVQMTPADYMWFAAYLEKEISAQHTTHLPIFNTGKY